MELSLRAGSMVDLGAATKVPAVTGYRAVVSTGGGSLAFLLVAVVAVTVAASLSRECCHAFCWQ